ncbi:MAG: hypothetical protein AB7Q17_01200 [Phycisphaerae bacterium]
MVTESNRVRDQLNLPGFVMVPVDRTEPHAVTLRDWFAGMWIAGTASHRNTPDINDMGKAMKVAIQAYRVADAMLAERFASADERALGESVENGESI